MTKRREMIWRTAGVAVGTALLIGVAGAAAAAENDSGAVDVEVDITESDEPGALALTVESGSASLVEDGSTDLVRQFTAALPTVTVTDTRSRRSSMAARASSARSCLRWRSTRAKSGTSSPGPRRPT